MFIHELFEAKIKGANDYRSGTKISEDYDSRDAVSSAITRRIMLQHVDLLRTYGPELVGDAIDSVADSVGEVDEIGSSDVSGWVNYVKQQLESEHGRTNSNY